MWSCRFSLHLGSEKSLVCPLCCVFCKALEQRSFYQEIEETEKMENSVFMYAHIITINNSCRSSSWKIHLSSPPSLPSPRQTASKACMLETRKLFTHHKRLKFYLPKKNGFRRVTIIGKNFVLFWFCFELCSSWKARLKWWKFFHDIKWFARISFRSDSSWQCVAEVEEW